MDCYLLHEMQEYQDYSLSKYSNLDLLSKHYIDLSYKDYYTIIDYESTLYFSLEEIFKTLEI